MDLINMFRVFYYKVEYIFILSIYYRVLFRVDFMLVI